MAKVGTGPLLATYALANAGGVTAYLPLLTLLLPLKAAAISPDARIGLLASLALAGAVAASASNIVFGWLSDRTAAAGGTRRGWIVVGGLLTAIAYLGIWTADDPVALVTAVVAFQVAVNAVLAPLAAIMADEVPDARKGLLTGLLALANPLAAAAGSAIVAIRSGEAERLALICGLSVALLVPLLLAPARRSASRDPTHLRRSAGRRDFLLAWIARLLVQTGGVVVSGFALFYFQSLAGATSAGGLAAAVGGLLATAHLAAAPIAVLAGMVSDRKGTRRPFLLTAAFLAMAGLASMALADGWAWAAAGLVVYICGSTAFLALNTALAMELLPSEARQGRDLGLLNLANTLPSLIGPSLAWLLAPSGDFRTLLLVLVALTALAIPAIASIRTRRPTLAAVS